MIDGSFVAHGRRLASALCALTVAGLAVGACSSSKSSSANGSTAATGGASSGTSKVGSSDPSKQIQDLSASVQAAEKSTFKADYKLTSNGTTQNVTVEQKPPKSVFVTSDGTVINDGTRSYFCSKTNGTNTCLSQAGAANPLGGIVTLFSPSAALGALQQAQAQIAARTAGYNADFSTQTFAGQSSNCVTITAQGQTSKYCVTKGGILAYSGTTASSFELTGFSTTVADADFALPAGATTVTIPGG